MLEGPRIAELVGYVAGAYLIFRAALALLRTRWARHAYPSVTVQPVADQWSDRCRGALLGHAIGDALNLPAESLPRWLVRFRYPSGPRMRRGLLRVGRRAGDVSDDTQLAIAVARSIMPDGGYCHELFVHELGCWSYARIGAGRACTSAAVAARRGTVRPSLTSEGNGAAIRAVALAIAGVRWSDEQLSDVLRENSEATHTSDQATRAAQFIGLLVRAALTAPRGAFGQESELRKAVEVASEAAGFELSVPPPNELATTDQLVTWLRATGTSGHVRQSVVAAVAVLYRHKLDCAAAMRTIFFAGGDTDSIGALVGSVIGAQLGATGLPQDWAREVQHRDYLCWLADRLAAPVDHRAAKAQLAAITGDVATRSVDLVVNAWNRNVIPPWLLLPQGVSRAIRRAGGRRAIAEVGRRAPLPLGFATETSGYELPCRWIAHVAGINLLWTSCPSSIRASTRNALLRARWLGARTVAVPLIGAGSGGGSAARAEQLVRAEIVEQLAYFDQVELVTWKPQRKP